MRALILIATLTLVAFGVVASARAGQNCVTNCSNTSDGRSQNCHTWCN